MAVCPVNESKGSPSSSFCLLHVFKSLTHCFQQTVRKMNRLDAWKVHLGQSHQGEGWHTELQLFTVVRSTAGRRVPGTWAFPPLQSIWQSKTTEGLLTAPTSSEHTLGLHWGLICLCQSLDESRTATAMEQQKAAQTSKSPQENPQKAQSLLYILSAPSVYWIVCSSSTGPWKELKHHSLPTDKQLLKVGNWSFS